MTGKRGISLGWRMGLMLFVGVNAVSFSIVLYASYIYQNLVMREFQERIINLGESTSQLVSAPIYSLQNYKIKKGLAKKRFEAKQQVRNVLDVAVERKDIFYLVIKQRDAVFVQSNSMKLANFINPTRKDSEKNFGGRPGHEVMLGNKKAMEVQFAIEYSTEDQVFSDLGEVYLGFDMTSVEAGINKTRNKALLIAMLGAAIVGTILLVFIYMHVIYPVMKISEISKKISMGEVGENIRVIDSTDEIGVLTKSFHDMALYISEISAVAEGISEGLLTEGFKPRSENDMLGKSFQKMLAYINEIAVVLTEIAKGSLKRAYSGKSDRDVLGSASATMLFSLRTLVTRIKEHSGMIANSSSQLQQISEQSQATISQLAETIANISQATSESAKNSQAAAAASMNAEEAAKQGGKKMSALLEKMQALSEEIGVSTKRMEKLALHSEEIKKMTLVIKAIADETKLLSFNAAIEAARAGEAGRGFVIVAEEIRKLSDLSTEQAVKIGNQIKEVRDDIASAIEMVQVETKSISESAELTKETGVLFADIEKAIDETAEQVGNIAASSEQIAASSEESASASEEQAAAMEELNAAVSELNTVAKNLKQETDIFIT